MQIYNNFNIYKGDQLQGQIASAMQIYNNFNIYKGSLEKYF